MVANPPVIIALSSDIVSLSRYGRIASGASVCPAKMLAAIASASAPETPISHDMMRASTQTIACMMPRW